MPRPTIAQLVNAREQAASGVDFSPRFGAPCPWCGQRSKIYKTMAWEDNVRVRYHRCYTGGCVVANMNISIKSIQVDEEKNYV